MQKYTRINNVHLKNILGPEKILVLGFEGGNSDKNPFRFISSDKTQYGCIISLGTFTRSLAYSIDGTLPDDSSYWHCEAQHVVQEIVV